MSSADKFVFSKQTRPGSQEVNIKGFTKFFPKKGNSFCFLGANNMAMEGVSQDTLLYISTRTN